MNPERFNAVLADLESRFGLSIDRGVHPNLVECLEGPIPLFNLILDLDGDDESEAGLMYVSFHIELDAPTAIQWYHRLVIYDKDLAMTGVYLKDAEGETYVGEDAQVLRLYMMEQDIVAKWMTTERDPEDIFNPNLKVPGPSPMKTFSDYKKAFREFRDMRKKKNDVSH